VEVLVEIIINKDSGEMWREFFEVFPQVDHLIWEGTKDEMHDLTVYFKDSDEPFPYSSLKSSSWLRQALKGCYNL
jgi:hypothetical protein